MKALATLILAAVAISIAWWWFVSRNAPAFPPLEIADDDPLILEATQRARSSIDRFRRLFAQYPTAARVKVPFTTSTGKVEYLWAQVEEWSDDKLRLLYLTPPVSHQGTLERRHTHHVEDVSDWAVGLPSGEYAGGYTMRVMFQRGREQWGSLPPQLAAEEAKYTQE